MIRVLWSILIIIWIGFLSISCSKTYTKEEVDAFFKLITEKYGIQIVYEIGEAFGPILIGGSQAKFQKAEPIKHQVLVRYSQLLQQAFEKYPDSVIETYLSAIHFARVLERSGKRYAGTYDPFRKIVYLANDGRKSDDDSIATFHHEFSSILLSKKGFFLNPWFEQNPDGFKYFQETARNTKELYSHPLDEKEFDYEKGFLNSYSQTNFENDFNEYVSMIFTHPKKFKKIMNKYPRVRGKFLLWLEFYQKIDPVFTEEYLLGK